MTRHDGRTPDQLRPVSLEPGIAPHATASVLARFGDTQVICAVTVEETVPRWMKDQGVKGGWITAEYSMLPYSTLTRKPRDVSKGRPDGRATEIQRLIGRSLRAAIDLERLGPRTFWVDCDVLQADGGTRTAAITGACAAVEMACEKLAAAAKLPKWPVIRQIAAVSAGIVGGRTVLDLDYVEDRDAEVDLNLVLAANGDLVEVQASGEEAVFSRSQLDEMLALAQSGIARLLEIQKAAVEKARA